MHARSSDDSAPRTPGVDAPDVRERPEHSHRPIGLRVTSEGRLVLQPVSDSFDEADGVDVEAADRIERAFIEGEPAGLLHLATKEASTLLPPSLAHGRRAGIELLHAVCSLPENQ